MGVYGYCVVPVGHRPADVTGMSGEPVELFTCDELGVWVGHMARPEPAVEAVQGHNRVVEAAITHDITPVPLRFGQWLENDAALAAAITEKAGWYTERLAEFAGALEFGLRAVDPEAPVEARDVRVSGAASGRDYMQALQAGSRLADQKRAQAEAVRARIQELMKNLVRAERDDDVRTPHAVLAVTHLVARPDFDEYRERARQLRQLFPALRWLVSGPWPPYSFAA